MAAGDLDAALVGEAVVVDDEVDPRLGTLLQAAHREVAVGEALQAAGASAEEAARAASPAPLAVRALDPDDPADERGAVAFIGVLLLYGQLLALGYWVASGIVEEKASRVVELLLAKARPSRLLAGKVVGVGVLGLGQILLFVVAGLGTALALGQVDIPPGTYGLVAEVVAWFVLGYALYACLFAVSGAIAGRPEDLQATTMPLSLVTMAAFFAALFAQEDPSGAVARVATFFPPSAPLVMPMRSAAGELPLWEAALGVALVVATIAVAVPVAGRIYGAVPCSPAAASGCGRPTPGPGGNAPTGCRLSPRISAVRDDRTTVLHHRPCRPCRPCRRHRRHGGGRAARACRRRAPRW